MDRRVGLGAIVLGAAVAGAEILSQAAKKDEEHFKEVSLQKMEQNKKEFEEPIQPQLIASSHSPRRRILSLLGS